jgi:hypothetical protein
MKSLPRRIIIATISLLEGDQYNANSQIYEISSEEELEHQIGEWVEYRSEFKTIGLGFLRGLAYYETEQISGSKQHMVLSLLGMNVSTRKVTIVLHSEEMNNLRIKPSLSIRPTTYW